MLITNRSDERLSPMIEFLDVNGHEVDKYSSLGTPYTAPYSKSLGSLKLSAEYCADSGITCFDDIEYITCYCSRAHRYHEESMRMLEYYRADTHPVGETIATDRGNIRVVVTEFNGSTVTLEVHVDTTTIPSSEALETLLDDIGHMTFVSGCGKKHYATLMTNAIDGKDLCVTVPITVCYVDDKLSLCYLVIGDEVWHLEKD